MTGKRIVYLDHAAATPLDRRVKEAMLPYLEEQYGNPSAVYSVARLAREALDNARASVAQILGCTAAEIIFTGSGTESDNLAIFGMARGYADHGKHVITTSFEHHAVLNPCQQLAKEGYDVDFLKVDRDGLITPEQLKAAIRADTILISIMYANNEVGTVEPIVELTRVLVEKKKEMGRKPNDPPFFHTDACQAAGYLAMSTRQLGVDLMTINGSKIYGPKGTGALYVRRGLRLKPLIYGGGQEINLRAGTENVAGIVGLAKALTIAQAEKEKEVARLIPLRDKLMDGIMGNISNVVVNGHATKRLPNNINVSILNIEGEAMLLYLDEHGICASTGSACDSQKFDPSHVIVALGKPLSVARGSIRFTLGRATTEQDIDYVLEKLPEIVKKLRKISPTN